MVTDMARKQREARVRRSAESSRRGAGGRREDWAGEPAAIYCRISHATDEDRTGVDRQERICRRVAERLGLAVSPDGVFVDNTRSAWRRNRKRPGWDALLELARIAGVRHILTYHPDRLMRQPKDLEELLSISDEHDITLHGEANKRDLSDPDDRFFLRIEIAHACRSSDDTSRRLKPARPRVTLPTHALIPPDGRAARAMTAAEGDRTDSQFVRSHLPSAKSKGCHAAALRSSK